jgi:hypothetical protein
MSDSLKVPEFVAGLEKLDFLPDDIPVHKVDTSNGQLLFYMFGDTSEFRVRTFFTKEPETLRWIEDFKPGDIFWDIGAKIGCYSLHAAYWKVCRCLALNPHP